MASYLRVQNAGKFQLNPFFKLKKVIKSSAIVKAEGGNILTKASDEDMKSIVRSGIFSHTERDIGEGLRDAVASNMSEGTTTDRYLVGALAKSLANKNGKTVEEMFKSPQADDFRSSLQTVIGYHQGGYLTSPLAKTLNLAVFPSRFETKVALAGGKWLSHQSPIVRVGVLSQMAKFSQWYGTPDGIKFQQQNADAIGLLKYFSPLSTIDEVSSFLGAKNITNLGQIGGLPFGVISTVLQGQGITKGSPYQNMQTGEVLPDSIPTTAKTRLQTFLTGVLGSLFSYPGKSAGFGLSKTDLVQSIPGLTPEKTNNSQFGKKVGYQSVPQTPTANQLKNQAVIGGGQSQPTGVTVNTPSTKLNAPGFITTGSNRLPTPTLKKKKAKTIAQPLSQNLK
jgi:hypothetical protein